MTMAASPSLEGRDSRLDQHVRTFMRPGVITLPEDASLRQAQRAMAAHDVRAVLIVGARAGAALGWVTSRGVLAWLHEDGALAQASTAITEPAVTIEPGATAGEAVRAFAETGATHLLVARQPDGRPQGVVTELDVVRLIAG
jgi:CBS domain-containing protein